MCSQSGHWAKNCPNKVPTPHTEDKETLNTPKREKTTLGDQNNGESTTSEKSKHTRPERKCYNCQKRGHIAAHCPSAFFWSPMVGNGMLGDVGSGTTNGDVGGDEGNVGCGAKECGGHGTVVGRGLQAGGGRNCGGYGGQAMVGNGRDGGLTSGQDNVSVCRKGVVEGTAVKDIILDTGCARTLIKQHLVPSAKKLAGQAITLRCAHGDTVLYPLVEVELQVDRIPLRVTAALSDTLPVSVPLGTDVPELAVYFRLIP